jgi:uncharacterized membrane protein
MSATEPLDSADPAPETGLRLVLPGRRRGAGDGWTWIKQGWKLFARSPLMWVISMVILLIFAIALNLVPVIGTLAFQVLQAVLVAGFVVACRSLETGGEFELEHLFAGFTRAFGPLAIVGLLLLVGWLVILVVFGLFVGFSVLGAFMTGDPEAVMASVASSVGVILLGTLVMLALMVPLIAAYWFAPALVIMHDMKPVAAMKASFSACLRNFVAFLIYGLVMLVALIVAMIPFGLGLFVWVPLAITSTYVAYRRIFTEEEVPEAPAPATVA